MGMGNRGIVCRPFGPESKKRNVSIHYILRHNADIQLNSIYFYGTQEES